MKNPTIISSDSEEDNSFDDLILTKSEQRKLAFKESLLSEPPSCPECHKIMKKRDLEKCNYCGFHYGYLEKIFPPDLPSLERLTDYSDELSEQDQSSINDQISAIESRYPQLSIKIAILPLQPDVEIQQMALWMLNNCPLPEHQSDHDRLWSILILIDPVSRKSCLTEGYKVEVIFTHEMSSSLVAHTNSSLRNYPTPIAISLTLKELLSNLDYSKKVIKKSYRRYKQKRK